MNYIPALSRLNRQPNRKKERCNPHQRVRKAVNRDETDRRQREQCKDRAREREQRKDRQTINQQKTEKYSRRRQRGGRNKQRKIVGQETERNKRITTDTVNEIVRTERQRDRQRDRDWETKTERQKEIQRENLADKHENVDGQLNDPVRCLGPKSAVRLGQTDRQLDRQPDRHTSYCSLSATVWEPAAPNYNAERRTDEGLREGRETRTMTFYWKPQPTKLNIQ